MLNGTGAYTTLAEGRGRVDATGTVLCADTFWCLSMIRSDDSGDSGLSEGVLDPSCWRLLVKRSVIAVS